MDKVTLTDMRDLRPRLPVRPSLSRTIRSLPVRGITLHYFGVGAAKEYSPEVELNTLISAAKYHQSWKVPADSLQYHFAITSDGTVWRTRDENLIAWHAGQAMPNNQDFAVIMPLYLLPPTNQQVLSWERLWWAITEVYGLVPENVTPHSRWTNTKCPGDRIREMLTRWSLDFLHIWRQVGNGAVLRAGPGREFAIVGRPAPGTAVLVLEEHIGQFVAGSSTWYRLSNGRYIHASGLA